MNQPNNPDESGQPNSGWQSDQGQYIQPAGSTSDPASQEPYGTGQTPTDNQGDLGTYPSYQDESGYPQQPSPVLPDPAQPAYQGQPYGQPAGYPQPGVEPQIPQTPVYSVEAGNAYTGEPPINAPWYGIGFVNACKRFFLKYATFSGRASRGEYWWIFPMEFLVFVAIGVLSSLLGEFGLILMALVLLAFIVPNFAVIVRRMHDSNMSGFWLLLPLATNFVGAILMALGAAAFASAMLGSSTSYIPFFLSGWIVSLGGFITLIIFMLLPSNPKGARFDRSS